MRNKGVLNCPKPKQNSFFPKYEIKGKKVLSFYSYFFWAKLNKKTNKQTLICSNLQSITSKSLKGGASCSP